MIPYAIVFVSLLGITTSGCKKAAPPEAEPRTDLIGEGLPNLLLGLRFEETGQKESWSGWAQREPGVADEVAAREAEWSESGVATPLAARSVAVPSDFEPAMPAQAAPLQTPADLEASARAVEQSPVARSLTPAQPNVATRQSTQREASEGTSEGATAQAPAPAMAASQAAALPAEPPNPTSSAAPELPAASRPDSASTQAVDALAANPPDPALLETTDEPTANPTSPEELAVRRAIAAAVAALFGAGTWYTDARARVTEAPAVRGGATGIGAGWGYTGIGAGPGHTGIGAGPGHTGIGAGSGYTGIGAGPGHTGIGAGPGHTGIGAGPGHTGIGAGPASTAATTGPNAAPIGIVVATPAGPVLVPVAPIASVPP